MRNSPNRRTLLPNGPKVTALRMSKGWTVGQLADAALVSEKTIRSLEQSKPVSPRSLYMVATALGVECRDLVAANINPEQAAPTQNRKALVLILPIPFKEFDETELLAKLRTFLEQQLPDQADDAMDVMHTEEGSTLVALDLSEEAARLLLLAYEEGRLGQFDLDDVAILDPKTGPKGTPQYYVEPGQARYQCRVCRNHLWRGETGELCHSCAGRKLEPLFPPEECGFDPG